MSTKAKENAERACSSEYSLVLSGSVDKPWLTLAHALVNTYTLCVVSMVVGNASDYRAMLLTLFDSTKGGITRDTDPPRPNLAKIVESTADTDMWRWFKLGLARDGVCQGASCAPPMYTGLPVLVLVRHKDLGPVTKPSR